MAVSLLEHYIYLVTSSDLAIAKFNVLVTMAATPAICNVWLNDEVM